MKYKALLEGLEAKEIPLTEVYQSGIMRMEAEFYNSASLPFSNTISASKAIIFSQYGTSKELNEDRLGYPVLRLNEYNSSFISAPAKYCNLLDYDTYQSLELKKNDVLICRTNGNPKLVGKSALVPKDYKYAFASYLFRVRPNLNIINSATLVAFLNSKYGRIEIEKYSMVGNQANFSPAKFREITLPIFSKELNNEVEQLTYSAFDKLEQSECVYSTVEKYLLERLGMTDFAANPDAYNVKTLKESFLETGRFDAEYYLPKYEDYCRLVQSYANGYEPLGDACDIKDTNYTPEAGVRYKYIELANIGKSGEITGCDIQDGENLPTRARRLVHQDDVIVSSIEGSLESCALVTDDYDGALCSTGFYVLQSSKLNPETLLTLFKSLPMQQLMKKGCSGTILTAISKPELEKLPVPIIRQEVQDEIAQHVQRSFALRKEAMQLLENAKLTVEQAIETGGGNLLIFNKLHQQAIQEERFASWLLLTEFGMLPTTEKENKTVKTCKKLSDSFLSSGRLDAEYYQPKYDYLFSHLSEFATSTIGELTDIRKSIEPGSDAYQETGVPFIRVSDMSKFGLSDTAIHLNAEDYRDVIRPKKDTILLSKDGSVGIAYKVEEPLNVITSGAILHLSLKSADVLSDYLTLVLNSPIVRLQAERDAGGSIIQHWKPSEIENVVIPILPMQIQQEIADKIKSSFKLRKESQQLLNEAKQMVEEEIEKIT